MQNYQGNSGQGGISMENPNSSGESSCGGPWKPVQIPVYFCSCAHRLTTVHSCRVADCHYMSRQGVLRNLLPQTSWDRELLKSNRLKGNPGRLRNITEHISGAVNFSCHLLLTLRHLGAALEKYFLKFPRVMKNNSTRYLPEVSPTPENFFIEKRQRRKKVGKRVREEGYKIDQSSVGWYGSVG